MKKTVLFAVLALICNLAYSQPFAALTIRNTTQRCTAYVNVWAADATSGNGNACDISTCTIVIPPTTTWVWADPTEIITGGGGMPPAPGVTFCNVANPPLGVSDITAAMTAGTWIWTDAQIQFSCQNLPLPNPPCTEGGCQIRGTQCLAGPSYCLGGSTTSWTSTSCLGGADWLPTTTMCFMDDVEIFIY